MRAAARPEAKTVVVGSPVQAVVRIRLASGVSRREFEQYVGTLACVRCAWQVTGDVDYELLAACPVVADLDHLVACLRGCGSCSTRPGRSPGSRRWSSPRAVRRPIRASAC
jgi:hypothetical protein